MSRPSHPVFWLPLGLGLVTFATLLLEILNSRLLSVLTWYHLSFLAVSLAMLGMAGGAVWVFLAGPRLMGAGGTAVLGRYTLAMAASIPIAHIYNLVIPLPPIDSLAPSGLLPLVASIVALSVPFVLSGVVVTIALTRTGAPVGVLYGFDLVGAALGALAVIPLLNLFSVTTAVLVAGAATSLGAAAFSRAGGTRARGALVLAVALVAAALVNGRGTGALHVLYPKNRQLWLSHERVEVAAWNTHSYVLVERPVAEPAFYWGPGLGADRFKARLAWTVIDGEAGTAITEWDGRTESLEWARYDVTSIVYRIRQGEAAIIGVGGGRDVLSALAGGSRTVTGIEINGALLDVLTGSHRAFAHIADRPEVRLVHDEARSYLTRRPGAFDVVQMSLIDTWAATGAGAFTLSENGLYTVEGWKVFLDALHPGGVLSVSRWFHPRSVSETNRLLGLGVAALLGRGIREPWRHMVLVSRGQVATLLVSNERFGERDLATLGEVSRQLGFDVLVAPGVRDRAPRLDHIAASLSREQLDAALRDRYFDYAPPRDSRPYFFNMLKPGSVWRLSEIQRGGVLWGNIRATVTLVALFGIALVLVIAIIVWPLARAGLPAMSPGDFALSLAYFGAIGIGFMLVQIPLMQRFSVYLGHPTYTFAIILFSMIFFAGLGSFLSERLRLDVRWLPALPLAIAVVLAIETLLLQPLIDRTVGLGLVARCSVVVLFAASVSVLLGFCFPIGMRLVTALSPDATAWMWGVNGASGVLASIAAVGVSMWLGIETNLWLAAGAYASLALVVSALRSRVRRVNPAALQPAA